MLVRIRNRLRTIPIYPEKDRMKPSGGNSDVIKAQIKIPGQKYLFRQIGNYRDLASIHMDTTPGITVNNSRKTMISAITGIPLKCRQNGKVKK